MAEEHPPSPKRKGFPSVQGIAGQARNDGLGSGNTIILKYTFQLVHTNPRRSLSSDCRPRRTLC